MKLVMLAVAVMLGLVVGPSSSLDVAMAAPVTCKGKAPTISGTDGDNVLMGTPGDDVIVGKGGDDIIEGMGGDDVICGNGGHDILKGGSGNDKLVGGGGEDLVNGGPGDDVLIGNSKRDTVTFAGSSKGVTVNLKSGKASGQGADTLKSIEDIVGSQHGDTLRGSSARNVMLGRGGSDTIRAKSGNDELVGGPGGDLLVGGPGNDTIKGGSGWDVSEGGGGDDGCYRSELRIGCQLGHHTFGSGTWLVPKEVPAGYYRNSTSSSGCYWARLSGFSGDLDDIIANEFTYALDITEVTGSEKGIESTSCGTWTNNLKSRKKTSAKFGAGAFLVGYQVKPGLWRNSNSSDGCYWERSSGFKNSLGEIKANGFSYDTQTVRIAAGDVGFTSSRCGTWTRIAN